MEELKRKQGGQPGNQNARTHGFYAKKLSKKEQTALEDASALKGVDAEIALLRVKIASVIDSNPGNVRVLTAAVAALTKLLKLKCSFPEMESVSRSQAFHDAILQLFRNMAPASLVALAGRFHPEVLDEAVAGAEDSLRKQSENSAASQAQPEQIK
jgi:hypothetical protein